MERMRKYLNVCKSLGLMLELLAFLFPTIVHFMWKEIRFAWGVSYT
jgi:hypothetical protein